MKPWLCVCSGCCEVPELRWWSRSWRSGYLRQPPVISNRLDHYFKHLNQLKLWIIIPCSLNEKLPVIGCEDVVKVSNVKLNKEKVSLVHLSTFCDITRRPTINLSPHLKIFNCKLFSWDRICILPHRAARGEAQSCTRCPMEVIVRTWSALLAPPAFSILRLAVSDCLLPAPPPQHNTSWWRTSAVAARDQGC